MYELKVVSRFAAAHNLRNFYGKCEDLHGHNWLVEVFVRSDQLDNAELVMDFGIMKKHLGEVLDEIDHKYLNELPFFQENNPSSENIARFIFTRLAPKLNQGPVRLYKVAAWESENSCAAYIPEP
ncbi:MAG: 6-carboxytetrahydropterin synthase QueD [Pseudomonadota bacterium]